jgi:hypothetical protein
MRFHAGYGFAAAENKKSAGQWLQRIARSDALAGIYNAPAS